MRVEAIATQRQTLGLLHHACILRNLHDFADIDGPSKFQQGRDSSSSFPWSTSAGSLSDLAHYSVLFDDLSVVLLAPLFR